MSRRRRALLALYPPSFRARYADELDALLDDTGIGPREVVDLLLGAARAWLRPSYGADPVERRRLRLVSTASTVWVAWCVVTCGTLGTLRLLEDQPAPGLDLTTPAWAAAHGAASAALLVSTLMVALGGVPLGVRAVVRSAPARRILAGPTVALGLTGAWTVAIAAYSATHSSAGAIPVSFALVVLGWALLVLATAAWWTVAVPRALRAAEASSASLRRPVACAVPAALALLVPPVLLVAVLVATGLGLGRGYAAVAGACVAVVAVAAVAGVVSAGRGAAVLVAARRQ